jgi:P-type Cu2+ transporter
VIKARANLSARRVTVHWREDGRGCPDLIGSLAAVGYCAHAFSFDADAVDTELQTLLKALAVAGFCAMNIMLLSVSVWFGADGQTRQAFHLVSAALALPAILYSGRVFYVSAWKALRRGRTNMDVPITIGVTLAFALSAYDTLRNAPHAYFDAATTLLFFLLIGRTLDHLMRAKARSAVAGLARLMPRGATIIDDADGSRRYVPLSAIEPEAALIVAVGDRIPVDGVVETGRSEIDCSITTGESAPVQAVSGTPVKAGTLNLTGLLTIKATARAEDSFLSEMVGMMEAAESGRADYRRLADRAAALYSPLIHTGALVSFFAWMASTGDWHTSVSVAISVLIITCPCALGLAVPMVQVMAARRLFERGIMLKDGSALERLAECDTVLFDKTGTLTLGQSRVTNAHHIGLAALAIAAAMAKGSRHPAALAIAEAGRTLDLDAPAFSRVEEVPGCGLEAVCGTSVYRLGRSGWVLGRDAQDGDGEGRSSCSVLGRDGKLLETFLLEDRIRRGSRETVQALAGRGLKVEILSGDRHSSVQALASELGVSEFSHGLLPAEKLERVSQLGEAGRKVLMVGDGLNDAPALAAAHVSFAPATAADVGRNAADFVFLSDKLTAVTDALDVAVGSGALIRQNFALAIAYNAVALPIAVLGYVTPLVAAIAMSLSSVIVVANALRLRLAGSETITATRQRRFMRVSAPAARQ